MTDVPAPPIPADADVSDFPFTPLYRHRLFGSAFHARATDAEWRAGVTLWLKSQDQYPSGSLPDDDTELCRLAELGRDLKTWRKIREGALRGWVKHADGRLYHAVVAEIVNDQWQGKIDQRRRTLKARVAALEKRLSQTKDENTKADIETQLQTLLHALSQTKKLSVTEDVTASKRKGKGEGDSKTPTPSAPVSGPAPVEPPVAEPVAEPVAPKSPKGARLASDWTLPEDWRQWATDELLPSGAGPMAIMPWIDRTALRFRDHWLAKAGRDAAKSDWEATWRNWVRKDIEDGKAPKGGATNDQASTTRSGASSDAAARVLERQLARAGPRDAGGPGADAPAVLPALSGSD